MSTQTIPTDRYGQPYYGPRTYREAADMIDREEFPRQAALEVADQMEGAGFRRCARRIRAEYIGREV